jgi:aspartyl-tRNA(Asn)/glutamyl-tRNA(Gln) amidotransferase subunit A
MRNLGDEVTSQSIESISGLINSGLLSAEDLTRQTLLKIREVDPVTNSFVTVCEETAKAEAALRDQEQSTGLSRGLLHGIPLAAKDLFDVVGTATTASSKVNANHFPTDDAHVITLLRSAGAIVIGKSHTHEFAYGGITPQSHNPWDPTRITGGSSGGSAAAVASGEAFFALGTDTAGSIRIPASCCGVVGLKPTFGRVSKSGVIPLAVSLDHVGPITRTVRDCALVLQTIAGYDSKDPLSSKTKVDNYMSSIEDGVDGLRIGISENFFFENCTDDVVNATHDLLSKLESLGADICTFNVRNAHRFSEIEFTIAMYEATDFHKATLQEKPELYWPETRSRLEAGLDISTSEYQRALLDRKNVSSEWNSYFENFDVTLSPTLPHPAPRPSDELISWPSGYSEDLDSSLTRLNCVHNLTMRPVITIPTGFSDRLPLGSSFTGQLFDEATVLRVARTSEKLLSDRS